MLEKLRTEAEEKFMSACIYIYFVYKLYCLLNLLVILMKTWFFVTPIPHPKCLPCLSMTMTIYLRFCKFSP